MPKKQNTSKRFNGKKDTKRELAFAEEGQEYFQAGKGFGGGRFPGVNLKTGDKMLLKIAGSLGKRNFISVGSIVIACPGVELNKWYILHVYTTDEARSLQSYGEIPHTVNVNATTLDISSIKIDGSGGEDDLGFDFESDFAKI
jgi:translation initiation factor 1A